MEQEFARVVLTVVGVGMLIAATGVVLLLLAFRSFASADAGKTRHIKLMVSVIAFVFLCCLVLFMISFR